VVYTSTDGHIYELWWDAPSGWHYVDLTVAAGAPDGLNTVTGYVLSDTQHVISIGHNFYLHELWWDAPSGWHHVDLTQRIGVPSIDGSTSLVGYVLTS
jgi:hypothetical protein